MDFDSTIKLFENCTTPAERYEKIIELGRTLSPYPQAFLVPNCLVSGCQSTLYLHSEMKEGKIYFTAQSDALISAGLAALMIMAYSGHPPLFCLQTPPLFLKELGILDSLSPTRSNGLAHLFAKMKKECLAHLANS